MVLSFRPGLSPAFLILALIAVGILSAACGSGGSDGQRGGNRDANMALWRIVLVRLRWDPTTRAYVERRVSEGKTRREAMRCLKRYIARDIHRILLSGSSPHQIAG